MELQRLPASAAAVDTLSRAVGDARHITAHPLPEVCKQLYPHEKGKSVVVSRFYVLRSPQLIVDFEPAPQVGKMHCEAKRRWCHRKGIVYVPVFLREKLTPSQFAKRVEDETKAMVEGKAVAADHAAVVPPDTLDAEVVSTAIEAEVLARLKAEELARGKRLSGAVRNRRIEALCQIVAQEMKGKANDGSLGYELRARELAVVAG